MASVQNLSIKQRKVDALEQIFNSSGVYLFDFRGLKVSEFETLRRKVKESQANVQVIKNRLAIKYFEKQKLPYGRDVFQGTIAVAYSDATFVETAKILVDFEKENKKIKILRGFIERKPIDGPTIVEVSKLPSREQLMTQLAFAFTAPLRKFGLALSAPLTSMLILLRNLKDKKEKGG